MLLLVSTGDRSQAGRSFLWSWGQKWGLFFSNISPEATSALSKSAGILSPTLRHRKYRAFQRWLSPFQMLQAVVEVLFKYTQSSPFILQVQTRLVGWCQHFSRHDVPKREVPADSPKATDLMTSFGTKARGPCAPKRPQHKDLCSLPSSVASSAFTWGQQPCPYHP